MHSAKINISEIFYSIQGEGLLAGRPSVFVRLAGCPLRCKYCDTEYALDSSAGTKMSIDQAIEKTMKYSPAYVVITGGEPMISPQISLLCQRIKEHNIHITIETAGIKYVANLACDLMSISPKLSNAYDNGQNKNRYLKINRLKELLKNYDYQLKFVMEKIEDITEVHQILNDLKGVDPAAPCCGVDRSKVLLMPQAKNVSEYLRYSPLIVELCKANGFIFSPRLQLYLTDCRKASPSGQK
jgi:7-carboxy-7-deazaguanine synthase